MRTVFQQPYPGAAPASKSYHRHLIELAAVGIVLGVVFLLFWQGVIRFGLGPATWDESYCRNLLGQYEPAVQTELLATEQTDGQFRLTGVFADGAKTVEIVGAGNTAAMCSITITSDQAVGSGFGNPYDCVIATVRYKAENQTDWLMAGIQTELIPDVVGIGNLGRFTTIITYYNPNLPDAVAAFDARMEKLRAQTCEL